MANPPTTTNSPTVFRWCLEILFFGAFFFYILLQVNPAARSYNEAPLFLNGWEITHSFSSAPGALLGYAGALISQLGQTEWLGALIITALAWFISFEFRALAQKAGGATETAQFIPGLFLLVVFNHYNAPAMQIEIAVALALGCAGVCSLISNGVGRWAAAAGVIAGLYWIGGPVTAMICAALVGLNEVLGKKENLAGLSLLVLGIGVPLMHACMADKIGGIKPWGDRVSEISALLLFLWIPGAVLLCSWLNRRAAVPGPVQADVPQPVKAKKQGTKSASAKQSKAKRRFSVQWTLLFVAIIGCSVVLHFTFNSQKRGLLLLDAYAEKQDWSAALRCAAELRESTVASRVQVLRALYQSGKLSSDMFSYAQKRKVELFPGMDFGAGPDFCLPLAHTLYEIGQVNLAEHFAHESLEILGNRPETLKLVIKINLVKNRLPAARMFLGFLRHHPFYRSWADHYLQALEQDPTFSGDDEITRIRGLRVKSDITSSSEPTSIMLEQSLQANPNNRMAFEFLMAHYLSTIDLEAFIRNLDRIKLFNNNELPRHYQEAIVFYQWFKKQNAPTQPSQVRPDISERFRQFTEMYREKRADRKVAQAALAAAFGDTYWFYALYGFSLGPNGILVEGEQP